MFPLITVVNLVFDCRISSVACLYFTIKFRIEFARLGYIFTKLMCFCYVYFGRCTRSGLVIFWKSDYFFPRFIKLQNTWHFLIWPGNTNRIWLFFRFSYIYSSNMIVKMLFTLAFVCLLPMFRHLQRAARQRNFYDQHSISLIGNH